MGHRINYVMTATVNYLEMSHFICRKCRFGDYSCHNLQALCSCKIWFVAGSDRIRLNIVQSMVSLRGFGYYEQLISLLFLGYRSFAFTLTLVAVTAVVKFAFFDEEPLEFVGDV